MSFHIRSTLRAHCVRETTSSARFYKLTGSWAFLAVIYSFIFLPPVFAHKSKYRINVVRLLTCHSLWHRSVKLTAVNCALQVFAYWICTATWCTLSIDRLEFRTTKDSAPATASSLSPSASPNTETRSHYGEISQTGKINKSKHSLNVLSIFSSMYLLSLCVCLLYDHMLESFSCVIQIFVKIKNEHKKSNKIVKYAIFTWNKKT